MAGTIGGDVACCAVLLLLDLSLGWSDVACLRLAWPLLHSRRLDIFCFCFPILSGNVPLRMMFKTRFLGRRQKIKDKR